jgi:hypothetical protein
VGRRQMAIGFRLQHRGGMPAMMVQILPSKQHRWFCTYSVLAMVRILNNNLVRQLLSRKLCHTCYTMPTSRLLSLKAALSCSCLVLQARTNKTTRSHNNVVPSLDFLFSSDTRHENETQAYLCTRTKGEIHLQRQC